jgi:alcohol dehydrogenase class IV
MSSELEFEFLSVPRILFGVGKFSQLGATAGEMGRRALVVYNGIDPDKGERLDQIEEQLGRAGVTARFCRQRGEPTVEQMDAGRELARAGECDMVIGVGGGSAIDAAKAIAALIGNGGWALDYMEVIGAGKPIAQPAAPWIAVPTTAGTGAEVTRNAVIGSASRRFKASIRGARLMARAAIVDPALGVNVSSDVTARTGMDALCQLIEAHASSGANPLSDAAALAGLPLAARSLRRACLDGSDLSARQDMALAALLSGIALTNAGLGAVHGFAAPLGANFPAPHGTICAALLAPALAANVAALRNETESHPALSRYATIGRLLVGDPHLSDGVAIDGMIVFIGDLTRSLSIPRLRQFGLSETDIPGMVALAKKSSSMRYNPVVLSDDVLSDVLRLAI